MCTPVAFIIEEELWILGRFITCHPVPFRALRTPSSRVPDPALGNHCSTLSLHSRLGLTWEFHTKGNRYLHLCLASTEHAPKACTCCSAFQHFIPFYHKHYSVVWILDFFFICSSADGHELGCFSLGLLGRTLWASQMTFACFWIPCLWNLLASALFRLTSFIWMSRLPFSCRWHWCVVWWGWNLWPSVSVKPLPLCHLQPPVWVFPLLYDATLCECTVGMHTLSVDI